ncbi:MAG: hypothetical protein GF353_27215 [Candidatus Lokiarchaeota archaeon]|nr:hypothetical protein [Candidatus Lokiarchaeota archaeon]
MIEKFSYVFIIGAGANKPYGFPLGDELYTKIQNNYLSYINSFKNSDKSGTSEAYHRMFLAKAQEFTEALSRTSSVSIDKYLNINNEFKIQGIHAITAEVYNSEISSKLPIKNNQVEGDWYNYLYRKLIDGLNTKEDLLRIHENRIAFITFNYDRSLEQYLFENTYGLLKHAGISRKELIQLFQKIPFIHVYGQIGYLPWQREIPDEEYFMINKEQTIVAYGDSNFQPFNVSIHVNSQLNIMYDERKDNPDIHKAHRLISEADRVLFLGFGYDDQNLNILKLPELVKDKQVYGTAYEATNNEIGNIKIKLNFKDVKSKSEIYNFDCLMLLREHLI